MRGGRDRREAVERSDVGARFRIALRDAAQRGWWVLTRTALRTPGPRNGPVVLVHVPKTAGGTATTMLAAAYSQEAVRGAGNLLRYPDATRAYLRRARWTGTWAGADAIHGHIPYGLFRQMLPAGSRYVTFLRDPLERVLSHYHRHIEPKSAVESLDEALDLRLPEVTNLATRLLCGNCAIDDPLAPSALEDAKTNLRGFLCVGVQERF